MRWFSVVWKHFQMQVEMGAENQVACWGLFTSLRNIRGLIGIHMNSSKALVPKSPNSDYRLLGYMYSTIE